jgi:hypothetical protein
LAQLTESRRPRSARSRARAGVAVLLAFAALTAGCTNQAGAAPAPSFTAESSPTPVPVPSVVPQASAAPTAAPSAVEPLHMAKSVPVRVQIPAIGVDSPLMDLGLQSDGTMEVPPKGFPAGWYTGAPTPGEVGPSILAGHLDWNGAAGVFYRLGDLKPGDTVTVGRKDGSVAVFSVTRVEQFKKDAFPTDLVYGNIDYAGMRLITCGGSFDQKAGHYRDNIVAFAELVSSRPA